MGYRLNLPPRYVQLCPPPFGRGGKPKPKSSRPSRKKVQFEDHANQTFQVARLPKYAIWYNELNYALFGENWRSAKRETEIPRKQKRSLVVGNISVPPMEDFQTFGEGAHVSRRLLVQSILKHQASCRARSYTDPVGYGMLSKSMTKNNRKLAWREEEEAAVSLSCLFFEYYMTSIHPYLNKPAVVMSKMLRCECD
jgi:hypothetical protein